MEGITVKNGSIVIYDTSFTYCIHNNQPIKMGADIRNLHKIRDNHYVVINGNDCMEFFIFDNGDSVMVKLSGYAFNYNDTLCQYNYTRIYDLDESLATFLNS